jgi:hypothetical protein
VGLKYRDKGTTEKKSLEAKLKKVEDRASRFFCNTGAA